LVDLNEPVYFKVKQFTKVRSIYLLIFHPFKKVLIFRGGLKAFLDPLFLIDQSNAALYRANVLARAFNFGAQV